MLRILADQNYGANIVGPICETGDPFANARTIERVGEGDLALFRSVGAYGFNWRSIIAGRQRRPATSTVHLCCLRRYLLNSRTPSPSASLLAEMVLPSQPMRRYRFFRSDRGSTGFSFCITQDPNKSQITPRLGWKRQKSANLVAIAGITHGGAWPVGDCPLLGAK
ncbi:hypothetical protein [Sphingopyxis sp.]|uniref:hypothetical protein n=1 Tax=Sphingopyxis sp. TaxID=1908224 RepID=UPI003D143AF0